ncbi:MAG: hypothetical protein EOO54_29730 [Haliea sp.]|nr:MAG: hypothetical protein EOO54_29730 [Haliea sp.]
MLLLVPLLLALPLAAHSADGIWFTVIGDHLDPAAETVQVNPAPVSVTQHTRVMLVRTSRASLRTSWDGVPFRSYQASVEFDCTAGTARFQELTYFMQPAWTGASHRTMQYSRDNPRWMRFRDMAPNPTERIIKAACSFHRVAAN